MPRLSRELTDPHATPLSTWPDIALLTSQTHWIRNTLDPLIAHGGSESLSINDVLTLDAFLRKLHLANSVSLADLRASRIHLAILEICGRATRWPAKLIERAEAIQATWEERFGPLRQIGWDLMEGGGRLEGCKGCEGLKREEILAKWVKEGVVQLNPGRARKWGDLGFKAGDWWINTLFAYRAGIVDSANPKGGIVADSNGAYAVLLTGGDEIAAETPEKFTYRARHGDKGKYRLTAATIDSRQPVRVLRAHTLRSFWAPRAGVRFEGMWVANDEHCLLFFCVLADRQTNRYKVSSWSISHDSRTDRMLYDITFKRLPSEPSFDGILARPWAEEIEDYGEYKRLRRAAKPKTVASPTQLKEQRVGSVVSTDGTEELAEAFDGSLKLREDSILKRKIEGEIEVYEDETADSPSGSVIVGGRWPPALGILSESSAQR